jgi:Mor family transcriptional regulator
MPPRRNGNEPTARERMFVKHLLQHKGNQTEAALAMRPGLTRKKAGVVGATIMHKPQAQQLFLQALEDAGLNDVTLAKKWNDAVKKGWGKKATHKDALRALTMVSKMKGWMGDQSTKINLNINAEIEGMDYQDLVKRFKDHTGKVEGFIEDAEIVE